jgi:hypothetical protein
LCSVDLEVLLPHLAGLCVERVECEPGSVTISARSRVVADTTAVEIHPDVLVGLGLVEAPRGC